MEALSERVDAPRKWNDPLTHILATGVLCEMGLGVVCWRYAAVVPLDAFGVFGWITAFVGGAAPMVQVWLGLRALRRTPLPDQVATVYARRLLASAMGTYMALLFVLTLFNYALQHLR
jgi:hypothetical protein